MVLEMIFLHGGLSLEMMYGLSGGLICSLAFFIFLVYRENKNTKRSESYKSKSNIGKLMHFAIIIFFVGIISFFSFYVFGLIFGFITHFIVEYI